MSKIILALVMLLLTALHGTAQCGKKVTWHATKADLIDASGTVLEVKQGTVTVETDSQKVIINIKESPEEALDATIKEKTCDWKEAFKNGKTVYTATLNKGNGETSNATFIIEAKDGKITLLVDMEKMEGKKMLVYIDTYEEAK